MFAKVRDAVGKQKQPGGDKNILTKDSIIIGMDVHKYAHQAVALNCLGQELSQLSFTNDELANCRTWLNGLGAQEAIVVGLEDVNGVGTRLSQFLLQEGFTCRYVPAILTERERKHSVQHDKSDYLDSIDTMLGR